MNEPHVIYDITDEGERLGYVALELPKGVTFTYLHLYILPECRSTKNIMKLTEWFHSLLFPALRLRKRDQILVNCLYEDTKTMELFKTFGFKPQPIWVGSMNF